MVIKGPVANAGSIPNLSSNSGMEVPMSEAITITETKAIVTMTPILTLLQEGNDFLKTVVTPKSDH